MRAHGGSVVYNPSVQGAPAVPSDAYLLYPHTAMASLRALNIRKLYFLDDPNASVPHGCVHSTPPEYANTEIPGLQIS